MQQYYYNTKEYKEGWDAWDRHYYSEYKTRDKNPYEINSEDYYNWNRGWNSNLKGIL